MKRILLALVLIAGYVSRAEAQNTKIQGFCEGGNQQVVTSGLLSTTRVQRSYPNCLVSVFDNGTSNLSVIYSNATGTVLGNPFTAASDGQWGFYVPPGFHYDVTFSGGGIVTPFTRSDWLSPVLSGGVGGTVSAFWNTVNTTDIITIPGIVRAGVACSPTGIFSVCGAASPQVTIKSTGTGGHEWALESDITTGDFQLIDKTVAASRLVIDGTGFWNTSSNVGIGCNPQSALHVCRTTSPQIILQSTGTGGHSWALQSDITTGNFELVDNTAGQSAMAVIGSPQQVVLRSLELAPTVNNPASQRVLLSNTVQGVMDVQAVTSGDTTAIHLIPANTPSTTSTIAELVVMKTLAQNFGGNYSRFSLSYVGPTVGNVSGLYIETGGTEATSTQMTYPFIYSIGVENPPGTFTSYEPMRFMNGTDTGNVSFGTRKLPSNVIQLLPAIPAVAGRNNSHAILFEGTAFDTGAHTSDWTASAVATDNAGHSSFTFTHRIDAAAYATESTLDDTGNLGVAGSVTSGTGGVTGSFVVKGATSGTLTLNTVAVAGTNTITGATAGIGVGTSVPLTNLHIVGANLNSGGITYSLIIDTLNNGGSNGSLLLGRRTSDGAFISQTGNNQPEIFNPNGGAIGLGGTPPAGYAVYTGTGTAGIEGRIYAPNVTAEAATKAALCLDTVTGEVEVNTGVATCTVSSLRFKEWVRDLACDDSLRIVREMKPAVFKDKENAEERFGFSAESVATIEPRLVIFERDGRPRALDYERYTAVLTKVLQCGHWQ